MRPFSRREALALGAGTVAFTVLGSTALRAAAKDAEAEIMKFTGGKTPVTGKIAIELPEIAENGNTVPLAFTVDSPMTEADHVTEVLVLADGNPRPGVATFRFSALSGKAEASTRIRLATTQNIIVVAKTKSGAFLSEQKLVKVTIGGCGG